jgi:hypothetical protein
MTTLWGDLGAAEAAGGEMEREARHSVAAAANANGRCGDRLGKATTLHDDLQFPGS